MEDPQLNHAGWRTSARAAALAIVVATAAAPVAAATQLRWSAPCTLRLATVAGSITDVGCPAGPVGGLITAPAWYVPGTTVTQADVPAGQQAPAFEFQDPYQSFSGPLAWSSWSLLLDTALPHKSGWNWQHPNSLSFGSGGGSFLLSIEGYILRGGPVTFERVSEPGALALVAAALLAAGITRRRRR